MVDFQNQQIRNGISPAFQPEQGTDYTGRMRDIKEANIAGYDIKPFEYADSAAPAQAKEMAKGVAPSSAFMEFFMQKYSTNVKYDYLDLSEKQTDSISVDHAPDKDVQIGQVILKKLDLDKYGVYVCVNSVFSNSVVAMTSSKVWKLIKTGKKSELARTVLSPADIPIPERKLCLCIKNDDLPFINITGTSRYDDSDYIFLYREAGVTYMQFKKREFTTSDASSKPAVANAWLEAVEND